MTIDQQITQMAKDRLDIISPGIWPGGRFPHPVHRWIYPDNLKGRGPPIHAEYCGCGYSKCPCHLDQRCDCEPGTDQRGVVPRFRLDYLGHGNSYGNSRRYRDMWNTRSSHGSVSAFNGPRNGSFSRNSSRARFVADPRVSNITHGVAGHLGGGRYMNEFRP